jgi:hypothetical protein
MKVFLCDPRTGHFFQNRKTWTAETRKAWDFHHVDHAIQVAADIGLDQVEVVLWFDDPKDELRLPVKIVAPSPAAKAAS